MIKTEYDSIRNKDKIRVTHLVNLETKDAIVVRKDDFGILIQFNEKENYFGVIPYENESIKIEKL